jgi:hypothetical protein
MAWAAGERDIPVFLQIVANASGLTVDQLLDVPMPADYMAKAKFEELIGSHQSIPQFMDPETWQWDIPLSVDDYVRFQDSVNATNCSGEIYQVTTVPEWHPSRQFSVAVAIDPTDPRWSVNMTHETAKFNITTLGLENSTVGFFFDSYEDAQAASCDPSEAMPDNQVAQGRRLAVEDAQEGDDWASQGWVELEDWNEDETPSLGEEVLEPLRDDTSDDFGLYDWSGEDDWEEYAEEWGDSRRQLNDYSNSSRRQLQQASYSCIPRTYVARSAPSHLPHVLPNYSHLPHVAPNHGCMSCGS